MAACNVPNVKKAKLYYKKLRPDAQTRYAVMCISKGIDKATLDAP
jgi:hypothetical protein